MRSRGRDDQPSAGYPSHPARGSLHPPGANPAAVVGGRPRASLPGLRKVGTGARHEAVAAMTASDELGQAVRALASGGEVLLCTGWPDGGPWLSEEPGLRAMAARWCRRCPVLEECDELAEAGRVTFGTWGGKDRTELRTHRRHRRTA